MWADGVCGVDLRPMSASAARIAFKLGAGVQNLRASRYERDFGSI